LLLDVRLTLVNRALLILLRLLPVGLILFVQPLLVLLLNRLLLIEILLPQILLLLKARLPLVNGTLAIHRILRWHRHPLAIALLL